jgi:protein ImuB
VVISRSGSKRWVSAADPAALKVGLRVGMPASKAQAMISNLVMIDADARADALAVERLALWCLRQYSPIVAVDGIDGVVMDTEGADHLHRGEELMISGLVNTLYHRGLTARVAISDTWGASYALSRLARDQTVIIPSGETAKAVVGLPIHSLRLPGDTVAGLGTMGFATVGELAATPRAPLALRFGSEVGRRIDQMFGRAAEVMEPLRTEEMVEVIKVFGEPIAAADTIAKYVRRLSTELSAKLEERGFGMKRADLLIHRVDSKAQSLRVGLAKPARDPARISKLLCDRIDQIDPGFGIEKLTLTAVHAEPLEERQMSSSLIAEEVVDVLPVVEILANRGAKLYRVTPVASDVPERSFARIGADAPESGSNWTEKWPRPPRLLSHPEPIEVMALLPDQPPVVVTWKGKRRKIVRADGPERIFGEWWMRPRELQAVRDYFVVEDDQGERLWIYRAGDGLDTATGSHHWFVHGVFA